MPKTDINIGSRLGPQSYPPSGKNLQVLPAETFDPPGGVAPADRTGRPGPYEVHVHVNAVVAVQCQRHPDA